MSVLKLVLKFDKDTYRIGERIQVTEELTNLTGNDVNIDSGSVTVHWLVLDSEQKNIDEWPYTDLICPPPGVEAVWNLAAGETFRSTYSIPIDDKEWVGFGVPGTKYQGPALEVCRTAGDSIYMLENVPGTYTLMKKFYTMEWIKERAKKFGLKALFEGELRSPPLTVRIVRK